MGYGDKLMAIGDAWALHEADPLRRPVAIGDGTKVDWCVLSHGLDFLADQDMVAAGVDVQWVYSYPSTRPYIDYEAMEAEMRARGVSWPLKRRHLVSMLGRYMWKADYRAKPGRIAFTDDEKRQITELSRTPFVTVEPFIKARAPVNKQWPVERTAEVIRKLSKDIKVVQLSAPSHPQTFEGADRAYPSSFREAIVYQAAAKLYIGPEGGLHHAAAAVDTPAVVTFGGFIDPKITGYTTHTNLTGGASHFCGTRHAKCAHCTKAMAEIAAPDVVLAARKLLDKCRQS